MVFYTSTVAYATLAASLTLTSCSVHYHVPEPDDLGFATRCLWRHYVPTQCQYDDSRYTIDKDELQKLLNELEEYKRTEYKRRSV